jgi:hypothetical protein
MVPKTIARFFYPCVPVREGFENLYLSQTRNYTRIVPFICRFAVVFSGFKSRAASRWRTSLVAITRCPASFSEEAGTDRTRSAPVGLAMRSLERLSRTDYRSALIIVQPETECIPGLCVAGRQVLSNFSSDLRLS